MLEMGLIGLLSEPDPMDLFLLKSRSKDWLFWLICIFILGLLND